MKWTHKVVYEDTGQWWMSSLVDGTLYHSVLHEEGERLRDRVESFKLKEPSIEAFYNQPLYKVIKLKTFKGNL